MVFAMLESWIEVPPFMGRLVAVVAAPVRSES